MSIDRDNLAPFISLLLARTDSLSTDKKHVYDVLADIKELIESIDDNVKRTLQSVGQPGTRAELTTGFLHYEEKRRPPWTRNDPDDVFDFVNHIVIVCQKGEFLAICSSSKPYQEEFSRAIRNKTMGLKTVTDMSLLDNGLLNAALIGELARTLWLGGLHKRTAVKADSKILSGVNLRDALSPVSDQSYAFSAVRSELPSSTGITGTVGVTPRKASLWTRPSRSWDDFQTQVSLMLDHIASAAAAGLTEAAPLPVLATPVGASDSVEGAYDMTVIAPELLADDPTAVPDPDAARFAYEIRFEVTAAKGPNFRAKVVESSQVAGTLDFEVTIGQDGEVRHTVEVVGKSNATIEAARAACAHTEWLTVYYESGHTLSGAQVYRPQFADMPFRSWTWHDFTGYDIEREKPLSGQTVRFDLIGKEKSLFSWTVNKWPIPTDGGTCWLACDDGANEVADFVALSAGTPNRTALLSLIHVKGSHSDKPNRELSTSAFEIVVSQALKNLRSLDHIGLAEFLAKGSDNKTKLYAWANGKRATDRTKMIKALEDLGSNYEREVVIIQPSARNKAYTRTLGQRGAALPGWYYRRAQLNTLLLEAEAACFGFGARLRVLADNT